MTASVANDAFSPQIWAVLIGSMIGLATALVSTWFSNHHQKKMLSMQLLHDASEREKKRKVEMRRNVYLEVAEECIKIDGFLGTMANVGKDQAKILEAAVKFNAALAKMQLVADTDASVMAGKLHTEYGLMIMKLMEKSYPLGELDSTIRLQNDAHKSMCAEVNRVLTEMCKLRESGCQDREAFTRLDQSFEFFQGSANRIAAERSSAWEKRNALHIQFVKELLAELGRLGELRTQLMIEMRKELEVGGCFDAYADLMKEQQEQIASQFEEMLKKLDDSSNKEDTPCPSV